MHEATIFGESVHLLVDADTDPGRLRDGLPDDAEILPIRASLEDVFVTMTRKAAHRD